MARYEFIDVEKATTNSDGTPRYSVKRMCLWLRVSTSGFYEWLARPVSATARRREELKPLIVKAFTGSDGRYGYPADRGAAGPVGPARARGRDP